MESFEVLSNGQVLRVEEIGARVIKSAYDMQYHVELVTDKAVIVADDIDTATVTASVKDYLGQPYAYSGPITFDVEGDRFQLEATDGGCTLQVTSDFDNKIDVAAWIANSRAGRVAIDAQENPA